MNDEKHQEATEWQALNRTNRQYKRTIRAILGLTVVTGLLVAAIIYQTIRLGREDDLIRHLEEQMEKYDHEDNVLAERGLLWFLGAALWTGNQIFSLYGLTKSCGSFTESAGNAALCVWGAVSTAATFIGVAKHGASTVKIIHDRLAQNGISIGGWKRDDAVLEAEAQMTELFGHPISLDGFVPHHHPKMARMRLAEGTMWPVFHLYNHHNTSLHFTMTGFEKDHAVYSLGFGHKSTNATAALGARESYNDEYFSNGGIDYTDCWNDAQSHYKLNKQSDYQQMDRDIQCYFPDLSNTWGAEIQMYDPNLRGTIGSGSIAAFRGSDHASSISVMPGCPAGIPSSDQCRSA